MPNETPGELPDCAYWAPEDPRWNQNEADADMLLYVSQMLDIPLSEVPHDILERCHRTHRLVQKAKPGGALRSTQVIATIVEQWLRERDEE